jgi:predicted metal-dependent hydrolase
MSDVFQLCLSDSNYYPYRLVKSRRAKYIRIKISTTGEISVVLPQRTSEKFAHGFVQKKLPWIEKTIANIPVVENKQFPECLDLKLLNQKWKIKYIKLDVDNNFLKEESEGCLVVSGDIDDWDDIKKLLNNWCKIKAKTIFKNMIEALAEEHGFHFNNLTIRSQKTRWGSCSNSKNISLNSKLIFLPINVVKYVMIHELCHTIEMNHSSSFWRLVEDCDNNYKNNRKVLKTLGKVVIL